MSHVPLTSQDGRTAFYAVPQEPEQQRTSTAHHQHRGSIAYGNAAYQYSDAPREFYSAEAYEVTDRHQGSPRQWESAPPMNIVEDYGAYGNQEGPLKHGQLQELTYAVPQQGTPEDYIQSYRPDPAAYYQQQEERQPDAQYRKRPNYKPSALRWPFLSLLLLVLIFMVALLAYSLRMLPVEDYNIPGMPVERPNAMAMLRRQDESNSTSSSSTTDSSTSSSPIVTATRPPGDFGSVGSVTVTISSSSSSVVQPGHPPPSDFGNADTSVTVTYSSPASSDFGNVGSVTVTDTNTTPQTPTYVSAAVTTLTNSLGAPTYTSTSIPAAVSTPTTTVLTNSLGQPTATAVTSVLVTPIASTLTNAEGLATATVTSYPVIPSDTTAQTKVFYTSYREYFVGFFLPTLLSILIAIPIRVLDLNAKLFQPWHELTHAHGATGRESLCLETSGWQSVVTSVRSLFGGQALVFLTTVLVLCSSLLIPLSAEAVALKLQGGCSAGSMSAHGCAYELSVFAQPAKATLGLLGFMIFTTILLLFFLAKWQSGVSTNPWSICGIAGLSQNKEVRSLLTQGLPAGVDAGKMPEGMLRDVVGERRFTLGWFGDGKGGMEYGIVLHDQYPAGHPLHAPVMEGNPREKPRAHARVETRHHLPFLMLGYLGRLLFLLVLLGILALILYYNNTGGDTPFERFMDSESFGVKFLFTSVGVVITFFWSSFFSSKSMESHHIVCVVAIY
jgi:hypothetical protein